MTEIHNLNTNELVLSAECSGLIYKQPRIYQNLDPSGHRYGASIAILWSC